jgi:hypothetical protein
MTSDWDELSHLFHEALARDVRERAAFLDQACAGDRPLRQELDSLLEHERSAGAEAMFESVIGNVAAQLATDVTPTKEEIDLRQFSNPSDVLRSRRSPFANLGADTLRRLCDAMELREYALGENLICQGSPADSLLVILSGTAAAQLREAPSDRGPIGLFGPGDVVGEMSLLIDEPRTADVLARTPVRALVLSAEAFHTLASGHPEFRIVLTDLVADRLGHGQYDGLGGKDINGYRILQCVGRGGMGIVYEAEQLATGMTVALKMMNHRLVYHPAGAHRFRREAAILKNLDHPCIARLYGCFAAYRTEFLAMEFCRGLTLRDIIQQRGALDESWVRRLLGQLAVTLEYIHDRGIVHRDLKPSNVMVDRTGSIKLIDFGLVKLHASVPAGTLVDTSQVSNPAMLVGTPRYMAPERFSGHPADRRSDFYGLACIAYEALAGRPVIEATDVFGIVQERLQFVLPPRERIGDGVSSEMHEVLMRGLDASPDNRTLRLDLIAKWAAPLHLDEP